MVAYMLGVTMAVMASGQTPPDSRKVQIHEEERKTRFSIDIAPNEQVFVAYTDGGGSPVYPLKGVVFSDDVRGMRLRLFIVKPEGSSREKWAILAGVEDAERSSGSGKVIDPQPKNEVPIPMRHLQVPVQVDGLEIHLFPCFVTEQHVGAMLVAIARDRQLIRDHIPMMERAGFDWNEFETAESFLPLRKDSEKSTAMDNGMD